MKIIILLGLLRVIASAPLIPQHLVSASNSNELLLNLNNARLLPLQFQGPFNSLTAPFSGILQEQQQVQVPGLSQFSLSSLDPFSGLLPNQIPIPGHANLGQGPQQSQFDPLQTQAPPQNHQGPNQVMPYVFSFKLPQEHAQMFQYYPVFVYLPWEQPLQAVTSTQLPQQAGPQQFEVQVPFYTQFEYIPQQVEPVTTGGRQQQLAFDPFIDTAPETSAMPAGRVISYLQREKTNSKHASAGIVMPSASPKPSTTNFLASAIDQTIAPEFMEQKAKTNSLREP
ncbi:PREDICTED: odontogenic ameloblast-associated protein [Chrysochloris asiatica]|uniref:Odontogenic ameloblast-associated protein n=1 Tax=Chrysochloris asiatica TaxID=185453 RepID=A0A9B0U141_CHRAS|nr:PREDICTED: odontogenic ameloblast-associated protein [Chrysochloris asiatica]